MMARERYGPESQCYTRPIRALFEVAAHPAVSHQVAGRSVRWTHIAAASGVVFGKFEHDLLAVMFDNCAILVDFQKLAGIRNHLAYAIHGLLTSRIGDDCVRLALRCRRHSNQRQVEVFFHNWSRRWWRSFDIEDVSLDNRLVIGP